MKEAAKWGGLYCYLAASPGSPFGPGGPAGPAGPISPSFPSFPSIPGPPAFPGGPGGPAGPSKHPDRVTAATHKTIKVLIRIVTLSKVERPVSSVGFCRRIDPKRTTPKIKGDHLTERLMESRIWRFMGDSAGPPVPAEPVPFAQIDCLVARFALLCGSRCRSRHGGQDKQPHWAAPRPRSGRRGNGSTVR
jgi:hypothetical protein